jgi:hypothetical protein
VSSISRHAPRATRRTHPLTLNFDLRRLRPTLTMADNQTAKPEAPHPSLNAHNRSTGSKTRLVCFCHLISTASSQAWITLPTTLVNCRPRHKNGHREAAFRRKLIRLVLARPRRLIPSSMRLRSKSSCLEKAGAQLLHPVVPPLPRNINVNININKVSSIGNAFEKDLERVFSCSSALLKAHD